MKPSDATPGDPADVDRPLSQVPVKSEADVLARARSVARRIDERCRNATGDTDVHAAFPDGQPDKDPPVS